MKNIVKSLSLIAICLLSNPSINAATAPIEPEITIQNNSHYPVVITFSSVFKVAPELFSMSESAEQAKRWNEDKITRVMPGKDFKYLLSSKDENKASIYGGQFNIHTMEKINGKKQGTIHDFNLQHDAKTVALYEFVPGDMIDKEKIPLKEKFLMIINKNGTISLK